MTLWSPDTCGCAIEYDNETIKLVRYHRRCSRHSTKQTDAEQFADVMAENQAKNATVAPLVERDIPHIAYYTDEGTLIVEVPHEDAASLLSGVRAKVRVNSTLATQ